MKAILGVTVCCVLSGLGAAFGEDILVTLKLKADHGQVIGLLFGFLLGTSIYISLLTKSKNQAKEKKDPCYRLPTFPNQS